MKYPKTLLFVLAASALLITTAAQPDITWYLLNEGYGLHYTSNGRQATLRSELDRARPPFQVALVTCDQEEIQVWAPKYGRALEFYTRMGGEDVGSAAIMRRYTECYRALRHPWETGSLASPVSGPETNE